MKKIKREAYADMYGPTTGDKVRLADTELFIEVKRFNNIWRRSKIWWRKSYSRWNGTISSIS